MKILIGGPTYEVKEYCYKPFLRSLHLLERNGSPIILADNSRTIDFVSKMRAYAKELGMIDFEAIYLNYVGWDDEHQELSLGQAREAVRKRLMEGDFEYWFSVESDVILPPDALRVLHDLAERKSLDAVYHRFPTKEDKNVLLDGIGCALFKKEVLKDVSFVEGYGLTEGDAYLLRYPDEKGFRSLKVSGLLDLRHIRNEGRIEP